MLKNLIVKVKREELCFCCFYYEKTKTHFIDIIEELKPTRSSWKIKSTIWLFFKYDGDDKKAEMAIFIHTKQEKTIMLETSFNVLAGIVKLVMKNIVI